MQPVDPKLLKRVSEPPKTLKSYFTAIKKPKYETPVTVDCSQSAGSQANSLAEAVVSASTTNNDDDDDIICVHDSTANRKPKTQTRISSFTRKRQRGEELSSTNQSSNHN